MVKMYSQAGQDSWVLSLFNKGYKGFFLDIGCNDPRLINNTLLLEEHGWNGISFDIVDFSEKWKGRHTPFVQTDVTLCDFDEYDIRKVIDYLSLDIDFIGLNYYMMQKLILSGYTFKSITIEHNLYGGKEFDERERIPQRKLLIAAGYSLRCPDVAYGGNKFEDWWINDTYINV